MTDLGHCDVCRFEYCPDMPEDAAEHRRRHREHMRFARPYRDKRLDPADPWVSSESPGWKHRIMYQFARVFRRELDYFGSPSWPEDGAGLDDHRRGFIVLDDEARAIGCCVFAWVEYTNAPHTWVMGWAYVVPPHRRQGVLSRHWPMFRETFGEFLIEPPLSPAMAAFARKHAPDQLPHPSWLEPENVRA